MPDPQSTPRSTSSAGPSAAASPQNSLAERIGRSVDDLLHLQVTTIVGTVQVSELPRASELRLGEIDNPRVMYSRIGLLDGDITTIIDERFLPEGGIEELRVFHQQRVEEGGEIVERNIRALKELLSLLRAARPSGGG